MYRLRRALTSVIAASALFAVAACSTSANTENGTGSGTSLTFLTFETPALTAKFWDDSITDALKSVPDTKINKIVSPNTDRNAYAKQLQASGQFPDILSSINPKDFIEANLLTPFDKAWLEENFLLPGANNIKGSTYIPPTNSQILPMVFYNKDVFAKNNITVPKTWAEFMTVVGKLKAAGVTPIELAGAEPWSASMPLVGLMSAHVLGKRPTWVADRYAGAAKFTDADVVAAVTKQRDLIQAGAFGKGALGVNYADANKQFLDGKSGMYLMGSWFIGQIKPEQAASFGSFLLPTEDGSLVVPFNVGGTTAVSAKAPDVAKATAFAKAWSLSPNNLRTLIETDGAFPMMKKLKLEDFGAKVTPVFTEAYTYVTSENTKVSSVGWVNNDDAMPPGVADLFYALSQQLFTNGDVKAQLAALDAAWDKAAGK
ncbi:ABC transporter substrate-binding protein [Catellatospora citrea]|uniref:ABC transporter substrate-binding protein n=1 Tax=Catellatospora citrea TaxID=53366 RepID=A0A8J3P483_9ACTN|nr:extracellular solute-binding protein [Catellatospora citrea]RKE10878.1 multiple sugar transport system substrate-binding protein/raffinose/stachyose/melibiose transport system substrate-binding protein [Catellatospora citrea]GIG00881.1 ABC transporter substrate-binding protein [Catellatospora citrea]